MLRKILNSCTPSILTQINALSSPVLPTSNLLSVVPITCTNLSSLSSMTRTMRHFSIVSTNSNENKEAIKSPLLGNGENPELTSLQNIFRTHTMLFDAMTNDRRRKDRYDQSCVTSGDLDYQYRKCESLGKAVEKLHEQTFRPSQR